MAKKIDVTTDAKTEEARPNRWDFVAIDHELDELVPEGSKRLDVIIYYDDVIPQQKIRDTLAGLTSAQKTGVKKFFFALSDMALEAHAEAAGLSTETDEEDARE